MKKLLMTAALGLLLVGCAPMTGNNFVKEGTSAQESSAVYFGCKDKAYSHGIRQNTGLGKAEMRKYIIDCMSAQRYQVNSANNDM